MSPDLLSETVIGGFQLFVPLKGMREYTLFGPKNVPSITPKPGGNVL